MRANPGAGLASSSVSGTARGGRPSRRSSASRKPGSSPTKGIYKAIEAPPPKPGPDRALERQARRTPCGRRSSPRRDDDGVGPTRNGSGGDSKVRHLCVSRSSLESSSRFLADKNDWDCTHMEQRQVRPRFLLTLMNCGSAASSSIPAGASVSATKKDGSWDSMDKRRLARAQGTLESSNSATGDREEDETD